MAEEREETKEMSYLETKIEGLDELFEEGVPSQSVNLIVGGPGSGKSIFGLQMLSAAVEDGETCVYVSLEESRDQLLRHMADFSWGDTSVLDEESFQVKEFDAFETAGMIETWLRRIEESNNPFQASSKPKLFEKIEEMDPDRVVLDSLSAIEFAFQGEQLYYRHYISKLFDFFREQDITAFVIVETQSLPSQITENGQTEFLADGVVILHRVRQSRGVEIYKMRGTGFEEDIVPLEIDGEKGIVVHPGDSFYSEQLDQMQSGRKF